MKRFFVIVLAVLIGVTLTTGVFAQTATEKATKAVTDTAKEKGKAMGEKAAQAVTDKTEPAPAPASTSAPDKKAEKKTAKKGKARQFTGEVTAIDMAAKMLTVKNKKGEKTFDLTDATMKKEPKTGDKILVKYTETDGKMIADSVTAKKSVKKTAKKK